MQLTEPHQEATSKTTPKISQKENKKLHFATNKEKEKIEPNLRNNNCRKSLSL
jgi:hypothetical protein